MKQFHDVFITGLGAIAPNGASVDQFWANCLDDKVNVAPIPEHWNNYYEYASKHWAPLPAFETKHILNRIELMQLDKTAVLAIVTIAEALANAGLTYTLLDEKKNSFSLQNVNAQRLGVFIGTGIGGISSFASNEGTHLYIPVKKQNPENNYPFLRFSPRFSPFAVPMSMTNTAAAMAGIKFGVHGPVRTFAGACAAGTVAIGQAFEAIRSGLCDIAIAGGVEYATDEYGGVFRGFDCAKTLMHGYDDFLTANCPFDKRRKGFLFAEGGCGICILESEKHLKSRNNSSVYAKIDAYAETFDSYSMMGMEPEGKQIERMLRMLLASGQVSAQDISYVNAHGTGTETNDSLECEIIQRVFHERVIVNATKSLTGHAIGAAGALETVITALSIKHQKTHGCHNLQNPISPLNFVRNSSEFAIEKAITQSFAFGGHNAALLLSLVK